MKKTGYVHIDGYDEISLEELKEIKDMGFKHVMDDLWVDKTGSVLSIKEKYDKYWCKRASITKNNNGYYQASCYSRKGAITVHELVMLAFIGPRPEGKQIDHIDRNKVNNKLENLRYVTPKENMENTDKAEHHIYKGRYNLEKQYVTYSDGEKEYISVEDYLAKLKSAKRYHAYYGLLKKLKT